MSVINSIRPITRKPIFIFGGRKAVVAATFMTMKQSIASNVFYLAVTEEGKKALPYLLIPLKSMILKDFMED